MNERRLKKVVLVLACGTAVALSLTVGLGSAHRVVPWSPTTQVKQVEASAPDVARIRQPADISTAIELTQMAIEQERNLQDIVVGLTRIAIEFQRDFQEVFDTYSSLLAVMPGTEIFVRYDGLLNAVVDERTADSQRVAASQLEQLEQLNRQLLGQPRGTSLREPTPGDAD